MTANGDARSGLGLATIIAAALWIAPPLANAADPDGNPGSSSDASGEIRVEEAATPRRPAGSAPGLDALLQLPSGYVTTEPDDVAGAGETEWRRRFLKAERELDEAQAALTATKAELDKMAGEGGSSQWSIAPPGGGGGDSGAASSPLSFKLRQQLRGDRERIDEKEKAVRELRIAADLAGVPQSWRVAESDSRASQAAQQD